MERLVAKTENVVDNAISSTRRRRPPARTGSGRHVKARRVIVEPVPPVMPGNEADTPWWLDERITEPTPRVNVKQRNPLGAEALSAYLVQGGELVKGADEDASARFLTATAMGNIIMASGISLEDQTRLMNIVTKKLLD